MNYSKIYEDFIKNRRDIEDELVQYEKHHIVPKCAGGTDNPDNIIKLKPSEHYFAHLVLIKMYMQIGNKDQIRKLIYSANMMSNSSPNNLFRLNHKYVGWLRKKFIDNHPNKTKEGRLKLSKSLKNYNNIIKMEQLEELNKNNIFPYTELEYKEIDGKFLLKRKRKPNPKRIEKKESNEKRSNSVKKYLNNLTNEEFNDRMNNSFLKYVDDPEWQKKRGEAISKAKRGKSTNQNEIMGKRYASMSDNEFEEYLKTKKPRGRNRLISLRRKYL